MKLHSFGPNGGVTFGNQVFHWAERGQNPGEHHSTSHFIYVDIKLDYLNPRKEDLKRDSENRTSSGNPPAKQKEKGFSGTHEINNNLK